MPLVSISIVQRKSAARAARAVATGLMLAAAMHLPTVQAGEPADTIDMSVAVGKALTDALDLMDAGKLDEASAAFQALRAQSLNDYEASRVLLQMVNLDITRNDHQAAITDSEALLATQSLTDAERASASLMLGKLYLQVENWNKGIETLVKVNEAQGGSSMETLYLLGFGHYRLQQNAQAVQYLEQAATVGGAQAGEPIYSLLGVLYVNDKNYPKAIEAYEKLFSAVANPTQAESYYSTLAQLYVQANNKVQAKATLEKLIAQFPNSPKLAEYQTRLAAVR